jgi:hypothetical protein
VASIVAFLEALGGCNLLLTFSQIIMREARLNFRFHWRWRCASNRARFLLARFAMRLKRRFRPRLKFYTKLGPYTRRTKQRLFREFQCVNARRLTVYYEHYMKNVFLFERPKVIIPQYACGRA